jgi:hypothetical protein
MKCRASSVWGAAVAAALVVTGCSCSGDPGPGPARDAGGGDGGGDADRIDGGIDAGVDAGGPDAGPPDAGPRREICEPCTDHAQCGMLARCVTFTSGERACVATCNADIPDCPRGFDCVMNFSAPDVTTCVPIGDQCCIDEDADGYGDGIGCLGRDCNDTEIGINPGADEGCNGMDDDCDGLIDDLATDCGDQDCVATEFFTYEEEPAGLCSTDGMCIDPAPRGCDLFTCVDGGELGTACATTCEVDTRDDDSRCILAAHCDGAGCLEDLRRGEVCDEDSDCESGHCDNGFCCNDGICCRIVDDCPTLPGGSIATCDDRATCQGSRGEALCTDNVCSTRAGVPDDSACGTDLEADTCGFFRSVFCTGAVDQPTPRCATTCGSDADCDDGAHCDTVCVPDLADGDACDESSDCASAHCSSNICCRSGDCCRGAVDCPSSYSSAPLCETPTACQGDRNAATCTDFVCGTITNVPDDSACTAAILADECGPYPSLRCNGEADQPVPSCATGCTADAECDAAAHCDGGACVPDLPDGRMCDEPSDCVGNHCQNGFCCISGDCCSAGTDCSVATYGEPSGCTDAATCQGRRRDPVCTATKQCSIGPYLDDDSGCAGSLANSCGNYPSVICTSAMMQPTDQMALCSMSCMMDGNCDPGAHCSGGACVTDGDAGDPCTMSRECRSGLSCVDDVCCTTACTAPCMACNVPMSEGTCAPVGVGQDPAGECVGVSCSAYYFGWGAGEMCRRRSDAPDSAVSCNGAGGCQTAADVCPARGVGDVQIDCQDQCQDPAAGTCSGMTAGTCNDFTPSPNTQTCGIGACTNTTPICDAGAPVSCMPLPPSPETCNDVNDDCDARTDEGLPSDGFETNNGCGTATNLGTIHSVGMAGQPSSVTVMPTLYGSGDVDVFRVDFLENDASCGCGGFFDTDEDYAITATLTVPAGAGSYEVCNTQGGCGVGTCRTVAEGTSGNVQIWKDGSCCPDSFCNDSGTWWIFVRGVGAPAFECQAYTLVANTQQGCR